MILLPLFAQLSTKCLTEAFRVVLCQSSIMRRLLCVINDFFRHLLLQNRWANLDQTGQECSFGGPLQTLHTEFDSIKNSGCHRNQMEFFKQFFFSNLLLWNCWSDFEILLQECFLDDPSQNC